MDYTEPLRIALDAAREVAVHLRAEFHRPGGPRGASGDAPIDGEVEQLLRDRLTAAFPAWGLRGEELGAQDRAPAAGETHLWLLDPNDGTSAMQAGFRGAAISIALIRGDLPVLGVVYAYAAPDDVGDLIAWAEGSGPVTRNGVAIPARVWPDRLAGEHTVLLSQHGDQKSTANARCVAPARFRPVPGIAYRLALVAAGEGHAAVSLFVPRDYDYAAGHALLRGAGGELFDAQGQPIRYRLDRVTSTPFCFGGGTALCREILARDWDAVLRAPRETHEPFDLVWPATERHDADAGRLSRAQGAWLGQLAGDALGSLVEFQSAASIARAHPDGPRLLVDGGTHDTLAGQPTDDSEMALLLARSLTERGDFDADAAASAYLFWLASGPFDVGGTIGQALRAVRGAHPAAPAATLRAAANRDSQANGALMRISPLGIFGALAPPERLAAWARADAALTHPNPVCGDANVVFVAALAEAVARGTRGPALYDFAVRTAEAPDMSPAMATWLAEAAGPLPADLTPQMGWVRWAFTLAFHHLHADTPFEAALVDTIRRGGDSDTNAAIVGALLGAAQGREAIPAQWRDRVTTCRSIAGLPGVRRPRPKAFHPVDAMVLAERLLVLGGRVR
jgi:ADP-ribosyl-[dinitrogen reductase] hydrolase